MKTYIYPENLRSTVKLWFWGVRDFCIICGGIIVAVTMLAKFWTFVPAAAVICYAFLTLRADDTSILDYMLHAVRYFLLSQKEYRWQKGDRL